MYLNIQTDYENGKVFSKNIKWKTLTKLITLNFKLINIKNFSEKDKTECTCVAQSWNLYS